MRMGLLEKAKSLLGKHDDKVDAGLEKAGEEAKKRFPGHDDVIDKAVDQAQQRTGQGDTRQGDQEPGGEPPPPIP